MNDEASVGNNVRNEVCIEEEALRIEKEDSV